MFRDDFTSISLSSGIDMPRKYLRDIETGGRTRREIFWKYFVFNSCDGICTRTGSKYKCYRSKVNLVEKFITNRIVIIKFAK